MEAGHTASGAAPRLAVQDQNQNYAAKRFKRLPRYRWSADSDAQLASDAKAAAAPPCQAFEIP